MAIWSKNKMVSLFEKESDEQMFFFLIEELGPWIMEQADLDKYAGWCTQIVNDKSWF